MLWPKDARPARAGTTLHATLRSAWGESERTVERFAPPNPQIEFFRISGSVVERV